MHTGHNDGWLLCAGPVVRSEVLEVFHHDVRHVVKGTSLNGLERSLDQPFQKIAARKIAS